jgi:type IV pilus assembly protein PilB
MLDAREFVLQTLLEDGRLTNEQAEKARAHAASNSTPVLDAVIALKICSSRDIAITRAKMSECAFVDLSQFTTDIRNAQLMPRAMAERLVAFPLFVIDDVATVAMDDPLDLRALDQLRQALHREIDPVLCVSEQLRALISRAYSLSIEEQKPGELDDSGESTLGDEPVVAAVNQIIVSAIDTGASDIHINPDEQGLHLRYRVDGVLSSQQGPPRSMHTGMVQRLKVMSKLDLTQTRRPQDGKFRFQHRGQAIDVRLSIVPTVHGENVVMRLLRPAAAIGDLSELMMPAEVRGWFEDMITRPHGMILVSGPTGSGKTTTLYTALHRINSPDVNIMTIEDPVEIRMPLIRQVQVNPEIGLDFAAALRSFLRQDPDVMLVGEIRDAETARIAVQAALTGHLVFSTVHTNDAPGAVARLRDLGVPGFAINNALLCAIAQRLVRRICEGCVGPDEVTESKRVMMGLKPAQTQGLVRGYGCARCLNCGYRGRLGVFEMMRVTPGLQELIERDASSTQIRELAHAEGMKDMWEDGLRKAQQGMTTLDELLKLRSIIAVDEPQIKVAA